VALTFVNRFQTRRTPDGKGTTEFLLLSLGIEFYPHWRRDTNRFVEQSAVYPFNPQVLGPSGGTTAFREREFTNLSYTVRLSPRKYFSASVTGSFDIETDESQGATGVLNFFGVPGNRTTFTHFWRENVANTTRISTTQNFSGKWQIGLRTEYNWDLDEFAEREYRVVRQLHDFVLSVSFVDDETRDDRIFSISISPKFLPGFGVGTSQLNDLLDEDERIGVAQE
jgi:hypothetical protein